MDKTFYLESNFLLKSFLYFYRMNFRAFLFLQLAIIYQLVTSVRNRLYDSGRKRSRSFLIKTICVGNLSMGGTGKSPMTEYIVNLLKGKYKLATLSRGYKRKIKGFSEVSIASLSDEVGDEPKQFKNKFPEIAVAVCEDRCTGVEEILKRHEDTRVILLDDAYQHRKIKTGLNILLSDHHKLFTDDFVFPSGTLRESRSGAKRADVVVITKCPADLDENEKKIIRKKIEKYSEGKILFSFLKYAGLKSFNDGSILTDVENTDEALLFTGIANPHPLEKYLGAILKKITSIRFSDHHQYSVCDLMRIQETFNNIAAGKKVIITTEKDAMRLERPEQLEIVKRLPLYMAQIEIDFFPSDKITFNQILTAYAEHD